MNNEYADRQIKRTIQLRLDSLIKLEKIVKNRTQTGEKTSVNATIQEAIDQYQWPPKEQTKIKVKE